MTEVVAFLALVGLVAVLGIALGMIVARRIDRIIAPPMAEPSPDDHQEEQLS